MNRISFASALSLVAFSSAGISQAFAAPKALPQIVPFAVEQIYVPFGFDDNDNSEVIVHGNLPSTCYKFKEFQPRFSTGPDGKVAVDIAAYVLRYKDANCLQMLIPFTAPVKLGLLKAGEYQVKVTSSPDLQAKPLNVVASKTESADDYLYAPVDSAELKALPQEGAEGNYQLTVKGKFPHMFTGCMIMKEVRTQLQNGNLLVVQPIAETIDDERCAAQSPDMKFSAVSKIKGSIPADVLVHVRSLNGQSFNKQFDSVPSAE